MLLFFSDFRRVDQTFDGTNCMCPCAVVIFFLQWRLIHFIDNPGHVVKKPFPTAFEGSSLHKSDVKEINKEWDFKLAANTWTGNTMWIELKNFYIKKLLSIEVDNKKKNLAANNEILHANMATLNKKLHAKIDESQSNQQQFEASVPAMINKDATTVDTTLETNVIQRNFTAYQAKMQHSMTISIASAVVETFKKNNHNTSNDGTPGNNRGRQTTRGTWQ